MPTISKRRSSSEMYPLIKQWLESGQKKSTFCQTHQLPLHTFQYWEQKYREAEKVKLNGQGSFIELDILAQSTIGGVRVEISHAKGLSLFFSDLPPVSYLAELLKVVEG